MKTMSRFLFTAAMLAAATTAASAADITAAPLSCDQPGCFTLAIDGDIKLGDEDKFEQVIKKNDVKIATVILRSRGGNLLAGIMIGRSIREKGLRLSFATA